MAKQKKTFNWIALVIIAIVIYFIANSLMSSDGPYKITNTEFYAEIGYDGSTDTLTSEDNKIKAIVQQGNTFYIFYTSSNTKNDSLANFFSNPSSKADCYFYATDYYRVTEIITRQFTQETDAAKKIQFEQRSVPQSVIDQILPFLYIGATIFIGYILLKSFSGRGGLGNMGRNRATITLNGPVRFSDVAGIEEEKEEVQEIVMFLRNPKKFLDMGARIPKGVLLVGAPGTGKTLLAKAIAGEAAVPFFSISGSDFSEMLVGVGPSRMRDLFEQAKLNAPCIIFIDEIDSIARMRGVGVSGVSDENEQTLNQLLVQMDGFTKSEGVIVLAATNRPDVLDQALLRPGRFDRQIIVQMPDVRGREKILEVHAKNKPIGSDVDLKRVASIISGFSGADIENLMNESAIIAAKKNKIKINMTDITEGINKVLLGPQKRSRIITEQDKKITAYHEAGHAIVSRILQPDQVVQEVSIIPRGMAAGYTLTNDKDGESHHKSKNFLNTQLAVYMSGRTAEQIFIGDICTGSSNDLKVATNLAENMVTKFGMSEKLGPLYYGKEDEIALRMYNDKHHSEVLQSTIDSEVKTLILAAEKTSHDILKAQSVKVHTMANILLSRETIYADDIALIMNGAKEPEVISAMETRSSEAKAQEKRDRTESEVAALERDLARIHEMANTLLEAKLIEFEKVVILERNFEIARELTRAGTRPKLLPSLENLDTYKDLVKPDTKTKQEKPTEQKTKSPKKKTTREKNETKSKKS